MTTINVPLLRKVMEHIEAHPDEHDQSYWAKRTPCGTTFCFAGWAVQLGDPTAKPDWEGLKTTDRLVNGRGIDEYAAELLGLGNRDAIALFSAAPDSPVLRMQVDALIARAEASGGGPACPSARGKSANP